MTQGHPMHPIRIILFAALPQEMAVFKRKTGPWSRLDPSPCSAWRCDLEDRSLLLVRTGMGMGRLAGLFRWATARAGCDLVVSFGFAGGLTPDLRVGDLCLCDRFCRWDPGKRHIEPDGLALDSRPWRQPLQAHHPHQTCIDVTTPRMTSKNEISRRLDPTARKTPALVDMESFALAKLSREASIPFVTLRAISDGLEDELDFDPSSIADDHGNLRIHQLVATVLRKPGVVRSFHRLWRDSRRAAMSLGEATSTLVSLPPARLKEILETSRVRAWNP